MGGGPQLVGENVKRFKHLPKKQHKNHGLGKMHGPRRVICFCFLIAIVPTILVMVPLYLRRRIYADVTYAVAESDVLEMVNGVSSIFCQAHSLKMNSSFSAFQVSGEPEISTTSRKHIRLKKSMSLPDDTLEYWGFFLPKGSTVHLSVCSRFDGSRILVVKGEKNMRSCGLMQPNKGGSEAHMAQGQGKVLVTFETAQEILPSGVSNDEIGDFEGEMTESINIDDHIDENILKHSYNGGSEAHMAQGQGKVLVTFETTQEILPSGVSINEIQDFKGEMTESINFDDHIDENILKHSYNDDINMIESKTKRHRHEKKRKKHLNQIESSFLSKYDLQKTKYDRLADRKSKLQDYLNPNVIKYKTVKRTADRLYRNRRTANAIPKHKLDGGMVHGGNARNYTERDDDSSVSSFENSLLECYDGNILLSKGFPPSHQCTNVSYLETGQRMRTTHEVVSDGYYYYIFYSDNDYVLNDIHAIFNIHKPTFQYENYTKGCINQTECTFEIPFLSDDTVVVEVPTRDGIEHEADDITYLQSTCHPRMTIYAIFPISALFLILFCAFL